MSIYNRIGKRNCHHMSGPLNDITHRSQPKHSSSTSSTEEMESDNYAREEFELIVRTETKDWLALHGTKLFSLETSKFLASEAKKKNLRSNR